MIDHRRLPAIARTGECKPAEASAMAAMLLEAKARRGDPSTSQTAAMSVLTLTEKRSAVLEMLASGPLTDEEIQQRYRPDMPRQSASGLRTRRSELVRLGLVQDSGTRRSMSTGRLAIVWARSAKAEAAL